MKVLNALFLLSLPLSTGCISIVDTGGETGGDTDGEPPITHDGRWVQCIPEDPEQQKLCIPVEDTLCSQETDYNVDGKYHIRSQCAKAFGGIPSDYPDAFVGDNDQCPYWHYHSNPEEIPEDATINKILPVPSHTDENNEIIPACTYCNFCYRQAEAGFSSDWDEIDTCAGMTTLEVTTSDYCLQNSEPMPEPEPEPEEQVWKCFGASQVCATMTNSSSFPADETEICLSGPQPPCVVAANVYDARDACAAHCSNVDDSYMSQADNNPDLSWSGLNCDPELFIPATTEDPDVECYGGGPMAGTTAHSVLASLSLSTSDGLSTTVDELVGVMTLDMPPCTSTSCSLSIEGLYLASATRSGILRDYEGMTYTYAIDDLALSIDRTAVGVIDLGSGDVDFTDATLGLQWATGTISLDGMELGRIPTQTEEINEIYGLLETDRLALQISYQTDAGQIDLSIEVPLD